MKRINAQKRYDELEVMIDDRIADLCRLRTEPPSKKRDEEMAWVKQEIDRLERELDDVVDQLNGVK